MINNIYPGVGTMIHLESHPKEVFRPGNIVYKKYQSRFADNSSSAVYTITILRNEAFQTQSLNPQFFCPIPISCLFLQNLAQEVNSIYPFRKEFVFHCGPYFRIFYYDGGEVRLVGSDGEERLIHFIHELQDIYFDWNKKPLIDPSLSGMEFATEFLGEH